MHCLHDPNQSNVGNQNNVRCEASRHFMNKKKGYLIDELEIKSTFKNVRDLCRDIIDFKKGYQPRPNIVKEEKGNLVTDSHSILARWMNNFSQLFIVHGVTSVRQTAIHTAEPLVPEPSAYEVEMKVQKYQRLV